MFDRLIATLDRHRLAISIGAGAWFWASAAVYARFLTLPEVPPGIKDGFFWSSVIANASWWGFLNPRIEARRKALSSHETPRG